MIVVLLGPPGAGKGTQAERIRDSLSIPHVSTGDMFRAAMQQDSDLGKSVKQYLESGQLVPDEVTSAVVADRMDSADCANGTMLDGYPRTVGQADALDGLLQERGRAVDVVLYFDVTDKTAVERLSGRRLCEKCGAGYHLRFMPPREADKCDKCGGKLYQRTDDQAETIVERLKVYREQTRALVEQYEKRGVLRRIDANHAPQEVAEAVAAALGEPNCGGSA